MFQRILVPIDTSCSAIAAFEHAIALAKLLGGELQLVHVEDIAHSAVSAGTLPYFDAPTYSGQFESNAQQSKELLDYWSAKAGEQGLQCTTRLIEKFGSNPAVTLLDAAKDFNADLIVMGTHGYSGFMHLIFGSVAENLLHKTHIPVLLIKKSDEDDEDIDEEDAEDN
jgi:nucleotide-binding universal stress UspA family protein